MNIKEIPVTEIKRARARKGAKAAFLDEVAEKLRNLPQGKALLVEMPKEFNIKSTANWITSLSIRLAPKIFCRKAGERQYAVWRLSDEKDLS